MCYIGAAYDCSITALATSTTTVTTEIIKKHYNNKSILTEDTIKSQKLLVLGIFF